MADHGTCTKKQINQSPWLNWLHILGFCMAAAMIAPAFRHSSSVIPVTRSDSGGVWTSPNTMARTHSATASTSARNLCEILNLLFRRRRWRTYEMTEDILSPLETMARLRIDPVFKLADRPAARVLPLCLMLISFNKLRTPLTRAYNS